MAPDWYKYSGGGMVQFLQCFNQKPADHTSWDFIFLRSSGHNQILLGRECCDNGLNGCNVYILQGVGEPAPVHVNARA